MVWESNFHILVCEDEGVVIFQECLMWMESKALRAIILENMHKSFDIGFFFLLDQIRAD